MTFSAEQKQMLAAPLSREVVKTRKQGGRSVSYVEAWHAIAEANRIFGFDNWTRETVAFECVNQQEREIGEAKVAGWGVTYTAKVRIAVYRDSASAVVREGCGAGHGIDRDLGQAHESALKEAESDAMKRALTTFGNAFGLALYDKEQANVSDEPSPQQQQATQAQIAARERFIEGCKGTIEEIGHDYNKLLLWWNSDAQKAARRLYQVSPGDIELLKARVMAKKPKEEGSQ